MAERNQKIFNRVGVLIALVIFLVAGIGLFFLFAGLSGYSQISTNRSLQAITKDDHSIGKLSSPIQIILYSDTECPYCNSFYQRSLPKILAKYASSTVVAYRHFPIEALHPNARQEAEATECSYQLGGDTAFWSYLDALFLATKDENKLNISELPRIASRTGLNLAQFEACMQNGFGKEVVEKNLRAGEEAGVNKTPSVLISNAEGKYVLLGGATYAQVDAVIKSLLAR